MNAPLPRHPSFAAPGTPWLTVRPPRNRQTGGDAFRPSVATEATIWQARSSSWPSWCTWRAPNQIGWQPRLNTPYVNLRWRLPNQTSVPTGDLAVEGRLVFHRALAKRAEAMVVRASQAYGGAGRPFASAASAAVCLRAASTTSSAPAKGLGARASTGATWCSSSRTARLACTHWKGNDVMHHRPEIACRCAEGLCSYPPG